MSDKKDTGIWWERGRQVAGVVLLIGFLTVHLTVRELPMWFIAMPFSLVTKSDLTKLSKLFEKDK